MLRKLLKYDMAAVWKNALILSIASLIAAVASGCMIVITTLTRDLESPLGKMLNTVANVILVLSLLTIVLAAIAIAITVLERFYKNLFTDEGYLTFTLPVSRSQIIASKTVNSVLWMIYSLALTLLSLVLAFLTYSVVGAATGLSNGSAPENTVTDITLDGWGIGYIIIVALLVLACLYYYTVMIQFCITLGSVLAKRARLIAIIGIYYLVNMVLSLIGQTIMGAIVILSGDGIFEIISSLSFEGMHFASYGILIVGILIASSLGIFFHSLTVKTLNDKLNLP